MAPRPLDPQSTEYWLVLAFLIVLSVADGVLIAILMFQYTDTYVLFVNQGTAFVYGCVSVIIVCWQARTRRTKQALLDEDRMSEQVRHESSSPTSTPPPVSDVIELGDTASLKSDGSAPLTPWYILVAIGILNGAGNCCQALGQPHTRGSLQALFSLSAIPMVMLCSLIFLKKRPSIVALFAAALIIGGIASSSAASFNDDSGGVQTYWYSVVIYAFAQLIYSGEKVFEEVVFKRFRRLDVLVMFMWTVWTQFFLGWALYPVQAIPAFGGIQISGIPSLVWDGLKCTAGISSDGYDRPECSWVNPMLFFTYCVVDFTCYAWGLYVIQRGGANLMILASAVATPVQQLVYALPINLVGFREHLHWTDAAALVMVVGGFGIYNQCAPEGRAIEED